jgi:hypothetical protein
MPWEVTENYVRSGHKPKGIFAKGSHRTITVDKNLGIKAVVACPKGKYAGGKCQAGMMIQSYLFAKEKGWTVEKAKSWFKKHEKNSLLEVLSFEGLMEYHVDRLSGKY